MSVVWKQNFSMVPGVLDYKILHYLPGDFIRYIQDTVDSDALKDAVIVYKDQGCVCYLPKDQIQTLVEVVLEKIINDPEWVKDVHTQCLEANGEYIEYARTVEGVDLSACSDEELITFDEKLTALQIHSHLVAVSTTWFVDSEGEVFSNHVIESLKKEMESADDADIMRAFSLLTTPTKQSLAQQEELSFLELAHMCAASDTARNIFSSKQGIENRYRELPSEILTKLESHVKKWRWTPYTYIGPAYNIEHYLYELVDVLQSNVDIASVLEESKNRNDALKEKQDVLLRELSLSEKMRYLLQTAQDIIWLKDYRKYAIFYGFYVLDMVRKEMAKRLHMTVSQVNHFAPSEIATALRTSEYSLEEANGRMQYSVLRYIDGVGDILLGEEAKTFVNSLTFEEEESLSDEGVFKGSCACPGDVSGVVKIVNTVTDMDKMNEGDILVAHTTFPSLLPAMKKASAIVTEDGGVTCHAAIVSRELNIPCVVGVHRATTFLTDGDKVQVDATHGMIHKI